MWGGDRCYNPEQGGQGASSREWSLSRDSKQVNGYLKRNGFRPAKALR